MSPGSFMVGDGSAFQLSCGCVYSVLWFRMDVAPASLGILFEEGKYGTGIWTDLVII